MTEKPLLRHWLYFFVLEIESNFETPHAQCQFLLLLLQNLSMDHTHPVLTSSPLAFANIDTHFSTLL